MVLKRLATTARATQATAAIEDAIRRGEFARGSTLPPERELALKLGIGRPALREAIRALAERGLVETRHGVGTVVVGDHHRPIADALGRALVGRRDAHAQVIEVRELLEGAIARRAAERATAAQRGELAKLQRAYAAAGDDHDQLAKLDADFHRALARAAGNPLFETMLSALRRAMTAAQRTALERMPALDVAKQHAAILAAVEAGDADGAATAMAAHLAAARAALS